MILLPAVDIRGGRAVRLRQGDFSRETVYADDPVEAARSFGVAGARMLHVVDLDGARDGEPANLGHLERIVRELGLPVQYGGGLRSLDSIRRAISAGAERVVLGTAALNDRHLLDQALQSFGDAVAVGVDVRAGKVSVSGWTEQSELGPEELIATLQERGARRFVMTSVDRDGMLEGPDLDGLRRAAELIEGQLIASGGIGSLEHLEALRELELEGVICGKALYEERFTVAEGQAALEG